jgi:hypothetical protein
MEILKSKHYTNSINRHQRLQGRGATRTVVMHQIQTKSKIWIMFHLSSAVVGFMDTSERRITRGMYEASHVGRR